MTRGAYGEELGETFRMKQPPTLVSSSAQRWHMAVTEMKNDDPGFGFTETVVPDDAFLFSLELRGMRQMELWLDGRGVSNRPVLAGGTNFFDLSRDPVARMVDPFHALLFYFPRGALFELEGELGMTRGDLRYQPGVQAQDPVIEQLGRALLHPLHGTQQTNALFVDQVLLALRSHLVVQYSDGRRVCTPSRYRLSPWQERCAKELIAASVTAGVTLDTLAKACHLSPSAFLRAFKVSTGTTPHQWLMMLRTELAMRLLRDPGRSLAAVAEEAGFADQSHFTRVFSARIGVTPGTWRRNLPGSVRG